MSLAGREELERSYNRFCWRRQIAMRAGCVLEGRDVGGRIGKGMMDETEDGWKEIQVIVPSHWKES